MTEQGSQLPPALAQQFPVLVIAQVTGDTTVTRSAEAIRDALKDRDIHVVFAPGLEDGEIAVSSDPSYSCIILSWRLCKEAPEDALRIIQLARRRTEGVPILLSMNSASRSPVPLEFAENMDAFIWLPEDSPQFIAGRIEAAARRYLDSIKKVADSALISDKTATPVLAALTNSTYDGLCYNVQTTTRELSKSVP